MTKIERVIIIGWDGAGNFITEANTPNLDRYIEKGTFTFDAQTVVPTISGECWGSLMHGVGPRKHGITNEKAATETYPMNSPYPSIFRVVREAYPESKLAAFSVWDPINSGIIESEIGVHKVSVSDNKLGPAAAEYIRENPDVKLMFVGFDWPDAGGHRHGYSTPGQLTTIEETDKYTNIILKTLEEEKLLEDSLLIFLSDHGGGGTEPYSHGSEHSLDKTIFWGCVGPGIKPNERFEGHLTITDTAAIVIYALGLVAPNEWESRVPKGLFMNNF